MRKQLILVILVLALGLSLGAQSHNAIPITQRDLYDFLDIAQIKGLLKPLPATRPYSRSLIASSLYDIEVHRSQLSPAEQEVLDDFIDRYADYNDRPFNQDGNIRIKSENFPTTIGGYVGMEVATDLGRAKDALVGSAYAGAYARGDAGKHLSWGVDFSIGGYLVDSYDTEVSYGPTGYIPYEYSKEWDGGVRPLSNMNRFTGMPTSPAFGYALLPEIAASFWDNRVEFRFSRQRHAWGHGYGSLYLDSGARPFFAIESQFRPFDWISLSSMTGILEYGEQYRTYDEFNIQTTSREQQNMYTLLQIELMPWDWISLTIFDAGIYLKRPEWGYVFPFMSRLLSQNNTGDYDNMMMGGTLTLSWPRLFKTYFSLYMDEAQPAADFFTNPRNQIAYSAGFQMPIPGLPWSNLTLQYTKIEPFTYTHYYLTYTPWISPKDTDGNGHPDHGLDTGYMNNGESLGYGLEPNSDEILLSLKSQIRRGISFETKYQMIRHGYPGGSLGAAVPGSTFDAWGFDPIDDTITPSNDPNGAYAPGVSKAFLKDGIYEWFHIVTLGATLDTRRWNEGVQFGLSYAFVALYYTDYAVSGWTPFAPSFRNVVTFNVSVSPW